MPYRASYPIFQLVSSAAANARHNMGSKEADSFISKAEVSGGTIVKKFRPRDKVLQVKSSKKNRASRASRRIRCKSYVFVVDAQVVELARYAIASLRS
jgi:hypothetical protein